MPEKIRQWWRDQGKEVIALLGVTPDELAIFNSLRTADEEDKNRRLMYDLGHELQEIDEDRIRMWKDWPYMLAVKKAFDNGLLSPHASSTRTHEDNKAEEDGDESKTTNEGNQEKEGGKI